MKFHNTILSLATTASLTTTTVVDAKLWTLRGLNGGNNNNNHLDTIKEESEGVVVGNNNHSETQLVEEQRDLENVVSEEQLERKLPKKEKKGGKKDKKGGKKKKDDDEDEGGDEGGAEEPADPPVSGGEEPDDGEGEKKGKKGKMDQKTGDAIKEFMPGDVQANAGCEDIVEEEDDGGILRRILKKGKGKEKGSEKAEKKEKGEKKKKTKKHTVATVEDMNGGGCNVCITDEEPDEEEINAAGLETVMSVEATNPSCDPDQPCEGEDDTGAGDDPTDLPEDAEEEVNVDEETARRRLTGTTNTVGTFTPLSCNPVEFDCTAAAGLSTVVGGGEVVVPCGTCLVYDLGENVTIPGLNIIGKLQVPTNYKSTLYTPHVFVQGELEMSDNQPISEDNTSMEIVLTGNTDVTFTPHEAVDGAASLNVGEKPFLVAGGKLNIRGWDDGEGSGKTWTPILGMAEASRLYPDTVPGESAPLTPLPHLTDSNITCPAMVLHDFEDGVDYSVWSGGEGGILSYDEASGTLTETNLERVWQGFRVDFTKFIMDCPITQDATYLVTMRLKIEDPSLADGADSYCETMNHRDHCPRLGRSIIKTEGASGASNDKVTLLPSSIGKNNEWFTFSTTWTWDANDLTDVAGQVFYLENFQAGQIIHMDEFQFELPSAKSYPPVDDPCNELVVNGDAENADGRGWNHYPMWTHRSDSWVPTILEETVDGVANKYWHVGNRKRHEDSVRFNVNHKCFLQGSTYELSVRTRYTGSKTAPSTYWFEIKGHTTIGYKYNKPLYCPSQSTADGWVTCSGVFVVDENYSFTENPEIIFVTKEENNDSGYVDLDMDDISIKFKSGPAGGLEIDGSDAARWGVNSDVHITSSTLRGDDAQDGRVKAISQKDNGNVVLELENPIAAIISEAEAPGYGVEIAVTSRNIKVIGEDDGTDNGGYLQVFHTPGVAQVIEGVEFFNMGQLSRKNRFAIQLLYNGDVQGTSISSNAIRESNMRCISVDGTANATIASNVGAGVAGHCFYFDRVSEDNMVINNLASNVNNKIHWNNRIDGWDDYHADGFSIWSPLNHFIGNVAAGGMARGFRYYCDWRTLGEDLVDTGGGNLRRKAMGTFKDNSAHSNYRQGFHLADFEQFFQFRDPENVPVFENLSAYRNREQGIYAWNCVNCEFPGGFLSDNQKGMEIRRSDGITVQDYVIQGQTETFKNYVNDNNSHKLCEHSGWTYEGIHMMGTMWRLDHTDPGFGLRLRNVALSGFDKEQEYYENCPSTEPIGMSADTHYAAHFDYKTSFENVTIDDGRNMIIDGCRASGYGYPDIVINDIDGSLDPDKMASSGALVSDETYMTGLFGDSCKATAGCMSYCAGVCLGMFTFFTERFGTETYKLRVTDTASGVYVDIPGHVRTYDERWNTYAYDGQRTFSASLPAGNYTAQFVDEFEQPVWPTYAEEQWAQAADCEGGVSIGDVTLIKPAVDVATECSDMIRNGDSANRTEFTPWIHTKWYAESLSLRPGEGIDGGNAIYMDRVHHWTGIAQNLNSLCTEAEEGQFYEFNAMMKMTDADGNPSTNIDPNREWWRNQSPILTLNDRQYRDASTKEYLYTAEHRDLANLVRPYDNTGWGHIHGIFKMKPTAARLWLELERAPDNVKFLLDGASLTPFSCSRDSLVRNGNLETGDSQYWDTWGGDLPIEVVPGGGPNGTNALKSVAPRGWYDRTQAQVLNIDCVNAGDRIAFSAKIKSDPNCDIYSWDVNTRCNNLHLYTNKAGVRGYNRVGYITADTPDQDGWHHVHGIHVLEESGEKPDLAKMYFPDANANWDVYTADVKASVLEQNCQALVMNPDFEEKDLYWTYIDRDRSKVKVIPGEGGSGHALRVYDRDHSWRGLYQVLDSRCFVLGEEFTISAKFRLTDASLAGVTCDSNFQSNWNEGSQCPSVVIYGKKCANGDVYQQFWNGASDKTWNAEGWNNYEASFMVNEELAACESVKLFIHQVNKNWNIEVDSVHVTELTTQAPTLVPTGAPTEFVEEETASPTNAPTARPTLSAVTTCPPVGEYVELPAGPIMLERSSSLCIITKADVDSDGTQTEIAPVARSSNGGDWEKHAGEFAEDLLYGKNFGDYSQGCQITLPELSTGQKYFIASYVDSSAARRLTEVHEEKKAAAHLMQHGTFGTTLADLDGWNKGPVTKSSAAEWVKEQMLLPMTSHREYFRERTNPRLTNPVRIGGNNHPCRANARWRKFAFSRKDGDHTGNNPKTFEASYNHAVDHVITIKLDGFVRTTVKSIGFEDVTKTFEFNKEYLMCNLPQEEVDGWFWLRLEDGSCSHLANPLVQFFPEATQPSYVVNLPNISGSLQVIDTERTEGEELISTVALDDALCDTLNDITEQGDAPVHGKLDDGSYVIFDPRLELQENTIEKPQPDGGGLIKSLTGDVTKCANAPRTFLNEDSCVLSTSATACSSSTTPDLQIELNAENIRTLHDLTGQYVYAILDLPVVDALGEKLESPCTPGLRSRWEIKDAGECSATVLGTDTNATLVELLSETSDSNTFIRDINFPVNGFACDNSDDAIVEMEIIIGSQCFKRVHPEHMSVFDFTYWTLDHTHPGNMIAMMEGESNPIKKWHDVDASSFLIYPSFPSADNDTPPHPLERWVTYGDKFSKLGRFGDMAFFIDLPNEMRTDEVATHFGDVSGSTGSAVVTCGSPGEVANDPTVGKYFVMNHERGTDWNLRDQKGDVFMNIAITAPDQLRQRVAFALSQILVVVDEATTIVRDYTEAFVTYHDIFSRNAFGNYRDILKEISYNALMAENLSFIQSKSAAYMWEYQQKVAYADENFAREIMQLFSTGLYMLNKDGSHKLDDNGKWIESYTNDEIMSFARIWTGFDYQEQRGNVEASNRVDPMRIEASWRDKFPKSDMLGGYIGDGYPLCVDLPAKMWLRRGAKYRLLGSKHTPELMEDDPAFKNDVTMKQFVLDAGSNLKNVLCNADSSGNCQYAMTVTLESNLDCVGDECNVDTARVVDVGGGMYYEYVSPACVEQAFYRDAKKVIFKERYQDSSCANPLLPYASEACCSVADVAAYRSPDYNFDQERVLFSTAGARCAAMGKQLCDFNYINDLDWHKKGYHWTSDSCKIQVKVDAAGQAAIVYKPNSFQHLHPHVDSNTRNFFKVYWDGDYPKNNNDFPDGNNCGNGACTALETGGCLCDTVVVSKRVFSRMPTSVDEVLSKLTIGAYDTQSYDAGTYSESVTENDVTVYFKTGDEGFTEDTIFEVTDKNRRSFRFKNSVETVKIQGDSSSFRNPPTFLSVLNTESTAGKAAYETDAALDHYFYHDNTAPFLALRMIQRMVTSNPSPGYIQTVADAFTSGQYLDIGTGEYGDMAAMVAAVLSEPQARDETMERDPFDGQFAEPLLQITRLSRALEIVPGDHVNLLHFDNLKDLTGQEAYRFDTVFSFFQPEYQPDATTKVGQATLVAPEAVALDGPKTVQLMNGMFSLTKYGLNRCYGGFHHGWGSCRENDDFSESVAHFTHEMAWDQPEAGILHADAVVSELSLLLTAGRLSSTSFDIIKNAYVEELPVAGHAAAHRLAVQLILTTPEFHTTQTTISTGIARPEPAEPVPSGVPYKAIVMVMLSGGADSFNMLVPHTCTDAKDMYQEYNEVRGVVALPKEDLIPLNDVSNQVCEKFGVHPRYTNVANMFNNGDLSWWTNTGVLDKETDKLNYWRDTVTNLFAHNWMQLAAQKADPFKEMHGTGILGRIRDAATKQGRSVGGFSIDWSSPATGGMPGVTPSALILNRNGVTQFNENPSSEDMMLTIKELNADVAPESGAFSDLWADHLTDALVNNQRLFDTLSTKTTQTSFPNEHLSRQLEVVAKMIDSRTERGVDGDVFYASKGGFDTHSETNMRTDVLFGELDAAYGAFRQEMEAKGIWNQVTLITVSDFARTLNPNGNHGVDHAWAGSYVMMGGAVKGGQIHGVYPDNLTDDGERMLGRGRSIPNTSWEVPFKATAEWFGCAADDMPEILPNMDSFTRPEFWIPTADVFNMA